MHNYRFEKKTLDLCVRMQAKKEVIHTEISHHHDKKSESAIPMEI